jgi:hypothetical protein
MTLRRQGGPAILPGTGYPFESPYTTCKSDTYNMKTSHKLSSVHLINPTNKEKRINKIMVERIGEEILWHLCVKLWLCGNHLNTPYRLVIICKVAALHVSLHLTPGCISQYSYFLIRVLYCDISISVTQSSTYKNCNVSISFVSQHNRSVMLRE